MSSSVFTTAPAQAHALHQALSGRAFLVIGLCAAWCNTCDEFRETFEDIAAARPDSTFVWIDIEDDAEIAGDIDIDNFPTLAVFHRERLLHFGVSLPLPPIVARLLSALSEESREIQADSSVSSLRQRLGPGNSRDPQPAPSNASSGSPSNAATN